MATHASAEEAAAAALDTLTVRGIRPQNRELPDDHSVTTFFREHLQPLGELRVVATPAGEATVITLPDGATITYRSWSSSGGATIQVTRLAGSDVRKIHTPREAK